MLTFATRLSSFGSWNSVGVNASFLACSGRWIFPSKVPSSRRRFVNARVSIPVIPGTPYSRSQSERDLSAFQCE